MAAASVSLCLKASPQIMPEGAHEQFAGTIVKSTFAVRRFPSDFETSSPAAGPQVSGWGGRVTAGLSLATLRDRSCNTSAFVLPRTDGCPVLQPFLKASSVRVAIDGATVGRTDEEGICPWVRTAGSPEWLAGLDWFISDFNSTHSCSPK